MNELSAELKVSKAREERVREKTAQLVTVQGTSRIRSGNGGNLILICWIRSQFVLISRSLFLRDKGLKNNKNHKQKKKNVQFPDTKEGNKNNRQASKRNTASFSLVSI